MEFGEVEIMREKNDIRLLKIGCRNNKISYCVVGGGHSQHYDDYDDALEEYNYRWLKVKYDG